MRKLKLPLTGAVRLFHDTEVSGPDLVRLVEGGGELIADGYRISIKGAVNMTKIWIHVDDEKGGVVISAPKGAV